MKIIYFIILIISSPAAFAQDCVVLLHGLGRTSHSMGEIADTLEDAGYIIVNNSYPSREKGIRELSSAVGSGIDECRKAHANSIHFVTHSLGGILVRQYFQEHHVPEAGRVVMIGPPNHGSEVATAFREKWWFKWFTGIAGQELGVESNSTPNQLKPIPLEIGIIAGTKIIDPLLSRKLPEPHDGKVSVESAKLAEMKDFLMVPYNHTFIAQMDAVEQQVKYFLAQGKFLKPERAASE